MACPCWPYGWKARSPVAVWIATPVEVVSAPTPIRDQHVENVLGQCPTHQKNWTVKEGGVSKAGKSYNAFWKCGEKDESTRSGYCDKKPVKAWVDSHPIAA